MGVRGKEEISDGWHEPEVPAGGISAAAVMSAPRDEETIVSFTNELPEERLVELAETYEARLSKQMPLGRNVARIANEARQKSPVLEQTKNKSSRRQTGNLTAPPQMTAPKNRWEGQLTITSTQAIADSGSVWLKAQNKAGELLLIRFDGASDSLKGGMISINGAALPVGEKNDLLGAIAKAQVPYGGELVLKRIQQHIGMFVDRAAGYEG